jgi:hypothetical protein
VLARPTPHDARRRPALPSKAQTANASGPCNYFEQACDPSLEGWALGGRGWQWVAVGAGVRVVTSIRANFSTLEMRVLSA